MQANRLILLAGTVSIALMVSACDISTPSQVLTAKLAIKNEMVTEIFPSDHVDSSHVEVTARKIMRNGNHDVVMTIPYLPGHGAAAANLGAAYKNAFALQGVTHFTVALVVMNGTEDAGLPVVSYHAAVASQQGGCTRIPGYEGSDNMDEADRYRFGCETQAEFGKMVADPADLLGRAPSSEADSRRNGIIIDPYQAGTPNQPLKGMSASSIGK